MKNILFIVCSLTVLLIACQKKDNNVPNKEQKILLARTNTTYTYDGSNMVTEYTYDANGRIISELEDKGTANEQLITYTYDSKGNIAAQKFPNRGSLKTEYTYDNQNRMISSQKYATDGTKDENSTYTYYEDRIEETRTGKTGFVTKRICTLAPDKKNLGIFTLYDFRGNVYVVQTNTYSNLKNPYRATAPFTFWNYINAIEKEVVQEYDGTLVGTDTYTYSYVANANGYPTSRQETSNGILSATTTYEYIIK